MNRDDLRLLAGITTTNDNRGREPLVVEAALPEDHHHFGLQDESNVAKTCVALAKAGITVDMEHAMGIYYFNFKTKEMLDKASAIMERTIDKSKEDDLDESYQPLKYEGTCNVCHHKTQASTDKAPIACKWGKCNGEVPKMFAIKD